MKLNTTYTSKDVNYNEEKFITLDKHFSKMIEDKKISGAAYCMSRYGKKFVEMIHRIPATGGGLFSTTSDLIKFGNMLLNNGYHNECRILGRLTISRMTTRYTGSHIKDYCWGAAGTESEYGLGPDLRYNEASFYTKGSYYHEGIGASCLLIDPKEMMVAAWVVPLLDNEYYGKAINNTSGIMWSGII